jgi:hypothetical protein
MSEWRVYLPSGSNGKRDLWLAFDEEVAGSLSGAFGVNECLVSGSVLVGVLRGLLGCIGSLSGALLFGSIAGSLVMSEKLGIASMLLLDVFWDDSCPKTSTNVMLVSNQRQPQLRAAAVKARQQTCSREASRCSNPSNGSTDSEEYVHFVTDSALINNN